MQVLQDSKNLKHAVIKFNGGNFNCFDGFTLQQHWKYVLININMLQEQHDGSSHSSHFIPPAYFHFNYGYISECTGKEP